MAFDPRTDWKNQPDTSTPVTAEDLIRIEQGIADAHAAVDDPAFPASAITSGTFTVARIPTLAASKVTGLSAALDKIDDLETRLAALEAAAE